MITKQYKLWAMMIMALALILAPKLGWAAETTDPTLDDTVAESSLNAGQQSRIDNLAQLSVELNLDEGLQELGDIVADLEAQLEDLDPEDPSYADLEAQLEQAQADLETAIAEAVGAKAAEIEAMREDMGWGQICHELGLHPSVLGMGFQKAHGLTTRTSSMTREEDQLQTRTRTRTRTRTQTQIATATTRSLKGGLAYGHGLNSKGETSTGKGLGAEKSKAGLGGSAVAGNSSHGHGYGGKSPDSGKGSEKSQGKSDSKGQGQGKGKGNDKSK